MQVELEWVTSAIEFPGTVSNDRRMPLRDANFTRYVLPEVETLLRVAMTLTAQPADAEDLVQDTLIRAYLAAHRFDGRHPRAWLARAQIRQARLDWGGCSPTRAR